MLLQLETRKMDRNDLELPALGFGVMGLSAFYGKPDPDEERFKVLDRVHELCQVFWDIMDM